MSDSANRDHPVEPSRWAQEVRRLGEEAQCLPAPATDYLTPAGLLVRLDRMTKGTETRVEEMGRSVEDRPLWAFRLGPARPGGVLLVSLLHACEWIGALALLDLTQRLLAKNPLPALTVVPVANPDGAARALASAVHLTPRLNRGNARGIDLNRNFPPTHRPSGPWAMIPWYRPGPFAASEPETAAIVSLARRARPSLCISFHSMGRWIFYPPAWRRSPLPESERHRVVIEASGIRPATGYRCSPLGRWAPWFRAAGTEIDFFAREAGALAFLIEVSRGGFARWGVRRAIVPFYTYNPPDPAREVARLGAGLASLIEGMAG